jgi:hypothetical protein
MVAEFVGEQVGLALERDILYVDVGCCALTERRKSTSVEKMG